MSNKNLGVKDNSSTKQQPAISAMEMFQTKRVEGEPDLVVLMNRDLTNYYTAAASKVFMADTEIISVSSLNPISQRIIINKWFTNSILKYRAQNTDKDVGEILMYIINDGTVDDWLELMQKVVIPFFKEKNVLNIIPGE